MRIIFNYRRMKLLPLLFLSISLSCASSPDGQRDDGHSVDEKYEHQHATERIENPAELLQEIRGEWAAEPLTEEEIMEARATPRSELLTEERFSQIMAGEEAVILYVGSSRCGSAERFRPYLESLIEEYQLDDKVVNSIVGHEPSYKFVGDLLERVGTPTVLFLEGGEIRDIQVGGSAENHLNIFYFLARNGLIEEEVEFLHTFEDFEAEDIIAEVRRRRGLSGANFDGVDFMGTRVVNGTFSGSSFRNANLRDVEFQNAHFPHVDFTGADITNADFSGALWSNTTCPNGTNSDDNNGTCEGQY